MQTHSGIFGEHVTVFWIARRKLLGDIIPNHSGYNYSSDENSTFHTFYSDHIAAQRIYDSVASNMTKASQENGESQVNVDILHRDFTKVPYMPVFFLEIQAPRLFTSVTAITLGKTRSGFAMSCDVGVDSRWYTSHFCVCVFEFPQRAADLATKMKSWMICFDWTMV